MLSHAETAAHGARYSLSIALSRVQPTKEKSPAYLAGLRSIRCVVPELSVRCFLSHGAVCNAFAATSYHVLAKLRALSTSPTLVFRASKQA